MSDTLAVSYRRSRLIHLAFLFAFRTVVAEGFNLDCACFSFVQSHVNAMFLKCSRKTAECDVVRLNTIKPICGDPQSVCCLFQFPINTRQLGNDQKEQKTAPNRILFTDASGLLIEYCANNRQQYIFQTSN